MRNFTQESQTLILWRRVNAELTDLGAEPATMGELQFMVREYAGRALHAARMAEFIIAERPK